MKRVLILKVLGSLSRSEHHDWSLMSQAVNNLPEGDVVATDASYGELVYEVGSDKTSITHFQEGWDIADFDLVIFNKVGNDIELAIAAAHYLRAKGVPFIDEYLHTPGRGKLASSFLSWSGGLPVPRTLYALPEVMVELFKEEPPFDYPFVLKADVGSKGKENYLVASLEQLQELLGATEVPLVAQPFIENNGDYRMLVMNGRVTLAIHRKGAEGSHLNNTSQGGQAALVDLSQVKQELLEDSIRAAELEKLTVAGVDVLVDGKTGRHCILEVNRAPQLYSGSFVDEKLAAYAQMIRELAAQRA